MLSVVYALFWHEIRVPTIVQGQVKRCEGQFNRLEGLRVNIRASVVASKVRYDQHVNRRNMAAWQNDAEVLIIAILGGEISFLPLQGGRNFVCILEEKNFLVHGRLGDSFRYLSIDSFKQYIIFIFGSRIPA